MLLTALTQLGVVPHGTALSDMTPSSSGDTGKDMPRPLLDCGPYANSVR
jgi:hypothetical protein